MNLFTHLRCRFYSSQTKSLFNTQKLFIIQKRMKFFKPLIISLVLLTICSLEFNTAFASDSCNEIIKSFFGPRIKRLVPQPNSILANYPQLIDQIESLSMPNLDYARFYDDFVKTNKRNPTLKDGIKFVYDERKLVLEGYDWFIREIDSLNEPRLAKLKEELKASQIKLNKFKSIREFELDVLGLNNLGHSAEKLLEEDFIVRDGFIASDLHYSLLNDRTGLRNFNGEFGELYAMATSGNSILSRGLMFRQMGNQPSGYEKLILNATDNFRKNMEAKSLPEIKKIVKKHGTGLFRKANDYLESTPSNKLSKQVLVKIMVDMVKSKEIDLVSARGGKIYWAEVKAYRKPISVKLLKDSSKKSIYDQLVEHKALRDLLGLRKKVELVFISPISEITPEAKRVLHELGYIPLSAY